MQQRAGDRLTAGHRLVPATERHREVAKGLRLFGGPRQGVEDLPARLVEADAALHQIVGHGSLQPQTGGEVVDCGDALAFGVTGFRDESIGAGRLGLGGMRVGRRRPRCRRAGVGRFGGDMYFRRARLGVGGRPLRSGFGRGRPFLAGRFSRRLVRIGGPRRLVNLCGLALGRLGPARRIGACVPLDVRLGRIEGAVRLGREAPGADRLHHRDMAHPAPARVFPQRYAHARGTSK